MATVKMILTFSQWISARFESALEHKSVRHLILTLFAALVIWDRYSIAGIAQWGGGSGFASVAWQFAS